MSWFRRFRKPSLLDIVRAEQEDAIVGEYERQKAYLDDQLQFTPERSRSRQDLAARLRLIEQQAGDAVRVVRSGEPGPLGRLWARFRNR